MLNDRDEISILCRGPSIDTTYQVRFIWPSGFRGEDFFKSTNQKQEMPVVVMFVNGSGRNVYRGLCIDASYQVSVHLAKWFQRRRFLKHNPQKIDYGGRVC